MSRPIRLTAVMTHPVQYYSPWFRFIDREVDELRLSVLYVTEPTPSQQGVGFGEPFEWDVPLREGYDSEVLRPPLATDRLSADGFFGLDAPGIGAALERTRPDAALVSGWHSLALARALAACRRRGIPLLYRGDTNLQGRSPGWKHSIWRQRTRALLSLFQRYLFVGTRARQYLESFGIARELLFHSPHAVDNEFFAAGAARFRSPGPRAEALLRHGISEKDFVVLFVGKLDPQKRPNDLIQAASRWPGRIQLLMAGSGPLQEDCRRLAESLEVCARWCGFVNQSRLGEIHAMADCLVVPSASETWGLVVNEAMAAGLPCIVSDSVGCGPDLVEPGRTGEVFPSGDVEALALHLERLRLERESGLSRAEWCREKIQSHSFQAAAQGLVAACRSVVP